MGDIYYVLGLQPLFTLTHETNKFGRVNPQISKGKSHFHFIAQYCDTRF